MTLVNKTSVHTDWNCLLPLNGAFNTYGISYSVNFACGFFTAVLSAKDQVPTQHWMGLFMSESNADSLDAANELLQSLVAVYNNIAVQLYEDQFKPALLESTKVTDWPKCLPKSFMDWCFGYCRGVDTCSLWLDEQYQYSLPMAMLGGAIDLEDDDIPTYKEVIELAMNIPVLAQSVYNIAFDAREDELELQSKKNKLGRNDLCHCGSGMKYKKCCLETDKLNTIH